MSRDGLVLASDAELGSLLDTVKYAKDESREYIMAASEIFGIVDSGRYDELWPNRVENLAEIRWVLGRTLTDSERADLVRVAEADIGNLLALADVSIEARAGQLIREALDMAWTKYGDLWDVQPTTVEDLDRVLMPESTQPETQTGAEQYLTARLEDPEYREAYGQHTQDISSEGRGIVSDPVDYNQ